LERQHHRGQGDQHNCEKSQIKIRNK